MEKKYKQKSSVNSKFPRKSKSKPKLITIDDLDDLPEIVYKYRFWSNDNHKTILTEKIVYMSAPFDFVDPRDCKLQKRYDLLTNEQIYNYYYNYSLKKHPNWDRPQHRKYARERDKKCPMRNQKYIKNKQAKHLEQFNERFGVLSLTSNLQNIPMWEKYGDNHKGFCVGFIPKIMFKYLGGGCKVQYYDTLPIIYPDDDFDTEHFKQAFSKEKKWEYEEEYRTHMFYRKPATIQDRQIELPKECYHQIVFGALISDEDKIEIIKTCKHKKLNVLFLQAKINNDTIELEIL